MTAVHFRCLDRIDAKGAEYVSPLNSLVLGVASLENYSFTDPNDLHFGNALGRGIGVVGSIARSTPTRILARDREVPVSECLAAALKASRARATLCSLASSAGTKDSSGPQVTLLVFWAVAGIDSWGRFRALATKLPLGRGHVDLRPSICSCRSAGMFCHIGSSTKSMPSLLASFAAGTESASPAMRTI